MVPIISGDIHRGQRNTIAAAGAVIVVAFQSYDGNTRLRTAIGTTYKSFTSCHTRISFPSRAQTPPEKALLARNLNASLLCSKYQMGLKNNLGMTLGWSLYTLMNFSGEIPDF
jgi:hypothetical protein